jgi:hypothetical protein
VGTDECGLGFDVKLPTALEEATFSYKFKFSAGYDWTAGGKLPGVCAGTVPGGSTLLLSVICLLLFSLESSHEYGTTFP